LRDPEFDAPGFEPLIATGHSAATGAPFDTFHWQQRPLIAAAIGLQLLVLVWMVAANTVPWHRSQTVYLRVVPLDPRDLMRGDYVTLAYDINRIPAGRVAGMGTLSRDQWAGRTVYVELEPEPGGRHYRGGSASIAQPAEGRFIRGTLTGPNWIEFGIESFFVQEGKGKEYEQAIRNRKLSAEIALTPDGRGAVRRLVFD
jgi:uncharacterized membrane-anchored protein